MPPHVADPGGIPIYTGELPEHLQKFVVKKKEFTVDDFRPVKPVGNGDMGTVFLVVLKSTNVPYAMKVMKKATLAAKKSINRADTERSILSSVKHPFLPSLFTHFETEKHTFLVMNYCSGGDLNILRQRQPEKAFSECAARFYAAEVLLALEYLHKRGVIYRDLKPENVLVQADGHIMLTDFDLSVQFSERKPSEVAKEPPEIEKKRPSQFKSMFVCGANPLNGNALKRGPKLGCLSRVSPVDTSSGRKHRKSGSNSEPRSNSFVGTVEYVAPEVVWGCGHGTAVDWWTFGIFLYEMVYGKTPFKSDSRKETFYNILCRHPCIPGPMSPLKDLLLKLLNKEPNDRLGSNGATEIKKHPFFEGVQWNALQFVTRPPCVPPPFILEEVEAEVERKRTASSKQDLSAGETNRQRTLKETFGDEAADTNSSGCLAEECNSGMPPADGIQHLGRTPSSEGNASDRQIDGETEQQTKSDRQLVEKTGGDEENSSQDLQHRTAKSNLMTNADLVDFF